MIPVDLLVWKEKSSQGINPPQATRDAENRYIQVTLYIVNILYLYIWRYICFLCMYITINL